MRRSIRSCCVLLAAAIAGSGGACRKSSEDQTAGNPGAAATRVTEVSQRLIRGDPGTLVIQREELPTDFAIAGGEPKGASEYSQVYFNPQALMDESGAETGLLGVIANLTVLDAPAAASQRFTDQGGLEIESVIKDIQVATPGAEPLGAEPYSTTIGGADKVLAFRVHYILDDAHVFEYRFRFRVANAVGNLIISALATAEGKEPATLSSRARSIAERQVAKLNSARR